jgi:hypothetical protein
VTAAPGRSRCGGDEHSSCGTAPDEYSRRAQAVNNYACQRRPLSGISAHFGGDGAAKAPGLVIVDRYRGNNTVAVHDKFAGVSKVAPGAGVSARWRRGADPASATQISRSRAGNGGATASIACGVSRAHIGM